MIPVHLRLTLEGPVAITQHSATVAGHRCLGHVPGGQLLGAFASSLGLDPSGPFPDEAWRMLCSGDLRFGDALPAWEGRPALPMPLCLHRRKGAAPEEASVVNLAVDAAPDVQLVQLREGYLTSSGSVLDPPRHHTLRTAMEAQGQAREGFLFGVEALEPGQVFLSRVDCRNEALAHRVREILAGRVVYLGRSRSAEFGRVRIEAVDPWPEVPSGPLGTRMVLWLASDVALRDEVTGMLRLHLVPADLGLPEGWRVSRSWTRVRRYSPFNAVRRRPDPERQVLCAGSVLLLEGPPLSGSEEATLRDQLSFGIGEHREVGLGQVVLQPLWPEGTRLLDPVKAPQDISTRKLPEDELGAWLQRAHQREAVDARAYAGARHIEAAMRPYQRLAPSQWGEVRRLAREARFRADGEAWLDGALRELLEHGARQILWKQARVANRNAREAFDEARKGATPAAIELAAARLVRREVE